MDLFFEADYFLIAFEWDGHSGGGLSPNRVHRPVTVLPAGILRSQTAF